LVLWIKSFHVISVIAWMAALLYLPRLMVYHADVAVGSDTSERFKVMERKLLKGIATPSMIASWVFGLWTAYLLDVWTQPWFMVKLCAVVVITGMHMTYAKYVRLFANDKNDKSHKFYRIINEVPAVLMIAVVILVIVKPF